jgi:hypothetical protein
MQAPELETQQGGFPKAMEQLDEYVKSHGGARVISLQRNGGDTTSNSKEKTSRPSSNDYSASRQALPSSPNRLMRSSLFPTRPRAPWEWPAHDRESTWGNTCYYYQALQANSSGHRSYMRTTRIAISKDLRSASTTKWAIRAKNRN